MQPSNYVPTSALDPFSTAFLENPYRDFDEIRETGPVVWLSQYGVWCSTRYAEVHEALADWTTFCSGRGVGLVDPTQVKTWRPPSIILEQDPPLHTRMRTILMGVLAPEKLRNLRQAFEAEAVRLVDKMIDQREIDGVTDVAEAFPLKVFGDALGLAAEGRKNILSYSSVAFNSFGPDNEVFRKSLENSDEIVAWTMDHCTRAALKPGSFGAGIFAAVDRGEATEAEATMLMRTFMTAGVDTTVNGLSNALLCFSRSPDQWDLLRSDVRLARQAFEEVIRLESPVQTFFRTATRNLEFGGQSIREGERIILFLGAANRDARQWPDPTRFDIRRRAAGHVGFGHGIHGCVGQMLARLEGEVMLAALSTKVRAFEPTGRPVQRLNNVLRGLASLPLRIHPV